MDEFLKGIAGAQDLFDWFGFWPSFHDGEILSLVLNRSSESELRVLTWEMTGQLDEKGFYILRKHTVVRFVIEEIIDLELFGFSCQNVVSGLSVSPCEEGIQIQLYPCYGLAGKISARKISIELQSVADAKDA